MLYNNFDKYALCFNKDLNGGCISRFGRMPVDTDLHNASDFADDFVKQSDKQSAEDTCARSSICPEQDSFLKQLNHVNSFCLFRQTGCGSCSD